MKYKYKVNGLDCANCTQKLEDALNKKEEINDCVISFATGMMTFESNQEINDNELLSFIQSIEDEVTIDNLSTNKTHHYDECSCGHHHEHEHHHDECGCGHHHADDVFTSWGLENVGVMKKEDLQKILDDLAYGDKYGEVLRAKGMVPSEEKGVWLHFDMVPEQAEIREGAPDFTGKVCVIGAELDEEGLKAAFNA